MYCGKTALLTEKLSEEANMK